MTTAQDQQSRAVEKARSAAAQKKSTFWTDPLCPSEKAYLACAAVLSIVLCASITHLYIAGLL